MKQYILLKDTPSLKAGAVLKREGEGYVGGYGANKTAYWRVIVEDNPEWFKEKATDICSKDIDAMSREVKRMRFINGLPIPGMDSYELLEAKLKMDRLYEQYVTAKPKDYERHSGEKNMRPVPPTDEPGIKSLIGKRATYPVVDIPYCEPFSCVDDPENCTILDVWTSIPTRKNWHSLRALVKTDKGQLIETSIAELTILD